jgi:hypothetical protein
MTEFDRVFHHFYFRDIANELAAKGDEAVAIFLDETDGWTDSYFNSDTVKMNRRLFSTPKTTLLPMPRRGDGFQRKMGLKWSRCHAGTQRRLRRAKSTAAAWASLRSLITLD